MNFLMDNPIANLRGPQFLAFFAVVSIAAILWAYLRSRAADETRAMAAPQLPTEFDPFEIAYLRGGSPELARLIILDLIARKYLQFVEAKGLFGSRTIGVAPGHPDAKYLETYERVVFHWMHGGKKADEIFPALPQHLEETDGVDEYRQELESRHMLTSADQRRKVWMAVLPALCIVGGLAAYKLSVALARGRTNVVFLIILAVISMIVLLAVSRPRRLTALGRDYFARIQSALGMLKDRMSQLARGEATDHLVLAVAAFGIAALEGTSYGYYPEMFKKAMQQSSSGCGSGCGSSCGSGCGGGGCGGGCGGCGS